MENRIRKKKSSKSIRPKLSKKKMAPFLVYPTIYYDGYLVLKNKNRENKHIENNSHANINRPSTAKEDHKK